MFTLHHVMRDGTPHEKVLLSSEFVDVMEHATRGVIHWMHPEDSRWLQMREGSEAQLVICQDGKPYRWVRPRMTQVRKWQLTESRGPLRDEPTASGSDAT